MPTASNGDRDTSASSLATDMHRAESLLAELAVELRRIPLDERTRGLHLRALALKRAVMHWPEEHPDEAVRLAVFDEVLAMQAEAGGWRRLSISRGQNAGEGRADD